MVHLRKPSYLSLANQIVFLAAEQKNKKEELGLLLKIINIILTDEKLGGEYHFYVVFIFSIKRRIFKNRKEKGKYSQKTAEVQNMQR